MNNAMTAAERFSIDGGVSICESFGCGHINLTYLIVTDSGKRYILQRINSHVFSDAEGLMRNIDAVTRHISGKTSDIRGSLKLIKTKDGAICFKDSEGQYWRMYDFVEGSLCLQAPETPEDLYQSAAAFGTFQNQLADFPAETLTETIPHFHDTPMRYRRFHEVLEADKMDRAKYCEYEIREYLRRESDGAVLQNMLREGKLPLRVTHNDTKLNNVMLDAKTRNALCVIDLDTVMPGLTAYDFGDSIRFGAAAAAEDERDLTKVSVDESLYRIFTRGFIEACPELTENELVSLPWGARLMTLECGLRFLTDYLEGDVYFSVQRPEHNLDRCRTQLALVMDMEKKWDRLAAVAEEEKAKLSGSIE